MEKLYELNLIETIIQLEKSKHYINIMINTIKDPFLRMKWKNILKYLDDFVNEPFCKIL